MKRILDLGLSVIVIGIIAWIAIEMFFGAGLRNAPSKDALRRIHHDIYIGLSQNDVLAIYERNKTDRTRLRTNIFEDTWEISMPFEFGATDPILYIQFDSTDKVMAIAMRSSDGIYWRPAEAPVDKGFFHAPTIKNKNG
jgi:hypothetical protein